MAEQVREIGIEKTFAWRAKLKTKIKSQPNLSNEIETPCPHPHRKQQ